MMDPLSSLNRGYAFVTFCTKEAAQEAVKLVLHGCVDGSLSSEAAVLTVLLICV